MVSRSKINVTNWPINAMHARQYSQLPFAWFWEQFFPFARGVLTNNKMFFWWFYLHSSFDSKERSFQETHHHANCDRNGNELSNPRTMKMVTSVTWIAEQNSKKKPEKKALLKKTDPFFANSIIACWWVVTILVMNCIQVVKVTTEGYFTSYMSVPL